MGLAASKGHRPVLSYSHSFVATVRKASRNRRDSTCTLIGQSCTFPFGHDQIEKSRGGTRYQLESKRSDSGANRELRIHVTRHTAARRCSG